MGLLMRVGKGRNVVWKVGGGAYSGCMSNTYSDYRQDLGENSEALG